MRMARFWAGLITSSVPRSCKPAPPCFVFSSEVLVIVAQGKEGCLLKASSAHMHTLERAIVETSDALDT